MSLFGLFADIVSAPVVIAAKTVRKTVEVVDEVAEPITEPLREGVQDTKEAFEDFFDLNR